MKTSFKNEQVVTAEQARAIIAKYGIDAVYHGLAKSNDISVDDIEDGDVFVLAIQADASVSLCLDPNGDSVTFALQGKATVSDDVVYDLEVEI